MKSPFCFLLEISIFAILIVITVIFFSPYEATISNVIPIEELWSIEDTRSESEIPLIQTLLCNGVPAAYSRSENTFYCSLGLDNSDNWPNLRLTVPNAKGITTCFSDDYSYDGCQEAIAEGYSYELISYTDTDYSYSNIIFTGLPHISLTFDAEMTTEDIPVFFEFGNFNEPAFSSYGRAHLRGDGSMQWSQKRGYRVEFTRKTNGHGKVARYVPGISETDSLLLVPMAFDQTLMLDRLSWAMYDLITEDTAPFSARNTRYTELFVNNEYAGVYLLMEPFDIAKELSKISSTALLTDNLYRTTVSSMAKDKPIALNTGKHAPAYELFHSPNESHPFSALEHYYSLWNEEDDEHFSELVIKYIDIESALRYLMLVEAVGLSDNACNNLYIWMHKQNGYPIYRFKPWDMDRSWGTDAGEMYDHWFVVPIIDRIVNLNILDARNILNSIWEEMKSKGFTYESVLSFVTQYEHELNDSGAFMRNALSWDTNASMADSTKILDYCAIRFPLLDDTLSRICATKEKLPFLSGDVRQGDPLALSILNY